jgi:hypothetical protein
MRIAISQPMFFPWVGAFEKIMLTDIYVHYNDVTYSKGSYTNRVQIKTATGLKWLTVPVQGLHLGQRIEEVNIDNRQNWRQRHLALLNQHYKEAPFKSDMIEIVSFLYSSEWVSISELSIASIETICNYFSIIPAKGFVKSSAINADGQKSRRVLNIVNALHGQVYICGAGQQSVWERYLDHEAFETLGIRVEYIHYQKLPYHQLHGSFTPYVSVLDLIANEGRKGKEVMTSRSVYWQTLVNDM